MNDYLLSSLFNQILIVLLWGVVLAINFWVYYRSRSLPIFIAMSLFSIRPLFFLTFDFRYKFVSAEMVAEHYLSICIIALLANLGNLIGFEIGRYFFSSYQVRNIRFGYLKLHLHPKTTSSVCMIFIFTYCFFVLLQANLNIQEYIIKLREEFGGLLAILFLILFIFLGPPKNYIFAFFRSAVTLLLTGDRSLTSLPIIHYFNGKRQLVQAGFFLLILMFCVYQLRAFLLTGSLGIPSLSSFYHVLSLQNTEFAVMVMEMVDENIIFHGETLVFGLLNSIGLAGFFDFLSPNQVLNQYFHNPSSSGRPLSLGTEYLVNFGYIGVILIGVGSLFSGFYIGIISKLSGSIHLLVLYTGVGVVASSFFARLIKLAILVLLILLCVNIISAIWRGLLRARSYSMPVR